MTVRFKIALTIFVTGVLTALGVIATVLFAFERFEHESAYHRADAFLGRVMANYDNLFEMHDRYPEEFSAFLRNLVLFEPTQGRRPLCAPPSSIFCTCRNWTSSCLCMVISMRAVRTRVSSPGGL